MNDETTIPKAKPIVSNIKDEDQFQEAIIAAKGKIETSDIHSRFETFSNEIHNILSRQDSDAALAMITR
jgi:hypothetical protein